jgi:hypothetical protein
MVAFVLTRALLEKFGSDTLTDISRALDKYQQDCIQPINYREKSMADT